MRTISVVVLSLMFIGCDPGGIPIHNKPDDTASCAEACIHLQELRCPEGERLQPDKDHPKGQTCTEFCEYTQYSGHALNPSCVAKIAKCEDLEPVCQRKTKTAK